MIIRTLIVLGVALTMAGCAEEATTSSPEKEKSLRTSFSEPKVDLSKVPEKDRARVEAIMRANTPGSMPGAQSMPRQSSDPR